MCQEGQTGSIFFNREYVHKNTAIYGETNWCRITVIAKERKNLRNNGVFPNNKQSFVNWFQVQEHYSSCIFSAGYMGVDHTGSLIHAIVKVGQKPLEIIWSSLLLEAVPNSKMDQSSKFGQAAHGLPSQVLKISQDGDFSLSGQPAPVFSQPQSWGFLMITQNFPCSSLGTSLDPSSLPPALRLHKSH